MTEDIGRVQQAEPGSRPADQAPAGLDASRFDPSRVDVGDRLWFESSQKYGAATWVRVQKVGRKWVTLGPDKSGTYFSGRVAIGSRVLDGGGHTSPGRLYASPEEVASERAIDGLWNRVREFTRNSFRRPEHLSADKLKKILSILRDRDGSAEGGETGTGSTEGNSPGPQDIAQGQPS